MDQETYGLCQKYGKALDTCPLVSEQDHLLRFMVEECRFPSKDAAIKHYFENGLESATKLKDLIDRYFPNKEKNIDFLEFASGYGMVTRFFKKVLPNLNVTACDIHREATSFIEEKLGTKAVLSRSVPEELSLPAKYEAAFALSFFSHMPRKTWTRWLKALVSTLQNGGLLIFTTHGLVSKELCLKDAKLDKDGFWFISGSEQKDINKDEYGTAVTTLRFVMDQLQTVGNCRIVEYKEGYWWGHQDVYIIKKISD